MTKILIIDDSLLVSQMLRAAFTDAGYQVAQAMDANQGYTTAIEFHPDLIILDIQLPDVTGFELCRVLKNREELRHVPIIMVTGTHHRTEDKVRGFQLGADDYVQKPFEMVELLERVGAVLRRKVRSSISTGPAPLLKTPMVIYPSTPEAPRELQQGIDNASGVPALLAPSGGPSVTESAVSSILTPEPLSLKEAVAIIFFHPFDFPQGSLYPSIAKPYLLAVTATVVIGPLVAAGANTKPITAGFVALGIWTILLSVLEISSSILGVALRWRDAAAVLSLAGLPVLLKLLCGLVFTVLTSLSPFYFTASPALFSGTASFLLRRCDLFELWSVVLLFMLMRRVPNGDAKKARWISAIVWIVAAALVVAFEKWSVEV